MLTRLSRLTAIRVAFIALLAVLVAACGTTPVAPPALPPTARPQPVPIPDESRPPTVRPEATARERIIDIAMQEWLRWGAQVVQIDRAGRGCVSESSLPPPPEYLAARAAADAGTSGLAAAIAPCLRYPDGTGMEATEDGCALALRYWHVLGRDPDCQAITTARWAWSAAFISWVMRQAGLNDDQFLTGEAHSMYVTDARDGILADPAFRVEAYPAVPRPGDMICSARDPSQGIVSVEQITFGRTPMHCDIVIEVSPANGVVKAIGGNIQQSVSMSEFEWNPSSSPPSALPPQTQDSLQFISTTPGEGEELARPGMPWLLVMRNQLK